MSKPKTDEKKEQQKTLALQINDITKASLERRKAFREEQSKNAMAERIASQKSKRGPSLAGRLKGASVLGGGGAEVSAAKTKGYQSRKQ